MTTAISFRVSAMLELGAGFHPELSGRDNIFLNGSILGLGRRQIAAAMDDIIEFSGIGDFVDVPVKVYSSGMYVRLGFSIAANLDPGDLKDYPRLQLRKFDHDQVNNLLLRTLEPIQEVLARDYEPGISVADWLLGRFDEQLSKIGLTHYRERVWWDALACAAAMQDDDKDEDVVREKLNWESYKIALLINDEKLLWEAERLVDLPWAWRPQRWNEIELEREGGIDVPHGRPLRLFR